MCKYTIVCENKKREVIITGKDWMKMKLELPSLMEIALKNNAININLALTDIATFTATCPTDKDKEQLHREMISYFYQK